MNHIRRPGRTTGVPFFSSVSPRVLVTGGAGFIGSHTCAVLAEAGYQPLILDNLSHSDERVLDRLCQITGTPPLFIEGDVRDAALLARVFNDHAIYGVMHFAGPTAAGDSAVGPLAHGAAHDDPHVAGTLNLVRAMAAADVKTLVFCSSAAVYGTHAPSPIPETAPSSPAHPYGRSKAMVEEMLADLHRADPGWRMARLRCFNAVGADSSGLIGAHPQGAPGGLMPCVSQVAAGQRERLTVHGGDYPTADGTGVRDYVHVMDLAEGHVAAMQHVIRHPGLLTLNLGSGVGASVLDVVHAFERASGRTVARDIGPRRAGDVAACWGDVSLAASVLGWRARRSLARICADSWLWQQRNPRGYGTVIAPAGPGAYAARVAPPPGPSRAPRRRQLQSRE